MDSTQPAITFGAQMGDEKVDEIFQPLLISLRKLLKIYCSSVYSDTIHEFAPIARIDGDIWFWNFNGCQKLRINRKGKYITVDVGITHEVWKGKTEIEIKKHLFSELKNAINMMLSKLKKEKINVDEKKLLHDLNLVEMEYLK